MVTIVRVDGEPNRNSFPMSSSKRYTLTRPVWRKAVVEDLTGMWCPNCPPGIASLEHLNRVAADRYIGLAAHDGDALGTGDYYEVFRLFPGRPKIVLNGSHNVSPYFGNSGTEEQSFGLLADVQPGLRCANHCATQGASGVVYRPQKRGRAQCHRLSLPGGEEQISFGLCVDGRQPQASILVHLTTLRAIRIWEKSVPEMQIF